MSMSGSLHTYTISWSCYRFIDSPAIFGTLYLIICFGHGTSVQDVLDPPEDCFRLQMIIMLLETCGPIFWSRLSKSRFDHFPLYFQTYVLVIGVIPSVVEFDLQVVLFFTVFPYIFNIFIVTRLFLLLLLHG